MDCPIDAICQERGISAKELVQRAGFSASTAQWLMPLDLRWITRARLVDVCRVLCVPMCEVLVQE